MAGIEGEPASVEENLKPGAEVHRSGISRHADITEISRAIAGGNVHAATQRHSEMGKVPADADTLRVALRGGAVAPGMVVSELNVILDIAADFLHALPAAVDPTESRPRQIGEFLGVAVAAAQEIHQSF